MKFKCPNCLEVSDWEDDDDGDYKSFHICPKCKLRFVNDE